MTLNIVLYIVLMNVGCITIDIPMDLPIHISSRCWVRFHCRSETNSCAAVDRELHKYWDQHSGSGFDEKSRMNGRLEPLRQRRLGLVMASLGLASTLSGEKS